jgi:hypothetical protein
VDGRASGRWPAGEGAGVGSVAGTEGQGGVDSRAGQTGDGRW